MAKKTRQKSAIIRVYNQSKQTIPLQLRAPQGDFYASEQQIHILPGKEVSLPKNHLMAEQIKNLQSRRMIKVIYDSETANID